MHERMTNRCIFAENSTSIDESENYLIVPEFQEWFRDNIFPRLSQWQVDFTNQHVIFGIQPHISGRETMEVIGQDKLWSFSSRGRLEKTTCLQVRKNQGISVRNYLTLATKVAHLQFANPNYVMLFRGQKADYPVASKNGDISSLRPKIFRSKTNISSRFDILNHAEAELIDEYERRSLPDLDRLRRHRTLRWSILQHYEICDTPLLDVTHSLRIAASFACDQAIDEAFIFVLGVPNLSGAITASTEAGVQIVRLSGVCPPTAVRPHIQEGYLLGEYPELSDYNQKQHYENYEVDFGRRLVAKFRISPTEFWKDPLFPQIEHEALYPDKHDPVFEMARTIKEFIRK